MTPKPQSLQLKDKKKQTMSDVYQLKLCLSPDSLEFGFGSSLMMAYTSEG